MKQTTKVTSKMKYVIMVGLLIIPVMYSFFYLKAFWDPYGNMQEIPVAIVNLDEGAQGTTLIKDLQKKEVLKLEIMDQDQANDGLQDGTYYAVVTIPKNFTSNLEKVGTTDRSQTTITYAPNQKSNYLASQIISKVITVVEKEVNANVTEEIVGTLTDKLTQVPASVLRIEEGLGTIADGTKRLQNGSHQLASGTNTLVEHYQPFHTGIQNVKAGSTELTTGVNDLLQGSQTLESGLTNYVDQVNNVASEMESLSTLLTTLSSHPEYINDPRVKASLDQASMKLNAQTTKQNGVSGIDMLQAGGAALVRGAGSLHQGVQTLQRGAMTLNQGLTSLQAASTQIQTGIQTLQHGANDLTTGTNQLYQGVTNAQAEVRANRLKTEEEVKVLDGLSTYAKAPVVVKEKDYIKVNEYGTAFAPYFMSISLWVGALMLFVVLYYDVNDRFPIFSRNATNKVKRTLAYMGVATLQAIALGLLLQLGLGYQVTNYLLYYSAIILTANAFILIIEFLIVNFNDVGKFLAILLLVLQLAASAGTFPIETVPHVFQSLYPLMPMHYTINLFKEALIAIDISLLQMSLGVVIAIVIIFFGINITCDKIVLHKKK